MEKSKADDQKLGEVLEKLVYLVGGGIKRVEDDYCGMHITVYNMGPGLIRIDLKE